MAAVAALASSLIMACAVMPGLADEGADHAGPRLDASVLEHQMHRLINAERRRAGIDTLSFDAALSRIARDHSRDMAERDYFAHEDPVHGSPTARARAAGYVCETREGNVIYSGVAENIAMEYRYASYRDIIQDGRRERHFEYRDHEMISESVVGGWMESPGHRANLLNPRSVSHGLGVYIDEERIFITQNLC